eukprot:10512508-Lingulodinium_polyedra.AAC.1
MVVLPAREIGLGFGPARQRDATACVGAWETGAAETAGALKRETLEELQRPWPDWPMAAQQTEQRQRTLN